MNTELLINVNKIDMVPFIQRLLYNAFHGVVIELDGYEDGCFIEIKIGEKIKRIRFKYIKSKINIKHPDSMLLNQRAISFFIIYLNKY